MFSYLVVAVLLFSLTSGLAMARRVSVFALVPIGVILFCLTTAIRLVRGVDLQFSLLAGIFSVVALQFGYLIGVAIFPARNVSRRGSPLRLDSAALSAAHRGQGSRKL